MLSNRSDREKDVLIRAAILQKVYGAGFYQIGFHLDDIALMLCSDKDDPAFKDISKRAFHVTSWLSKHGYIEGKIYSDCTARYRITPLGESIMEKEIDGKKLHMKIAKAIADRAPDLLIQLLSTLIR